MIHYPIGEILMEMGAVTAAQLEAALHVQSASGLKLGEILLQLNFATPKELARSMALQQERDYTDLETLVPQKEALAAVGMEFAQLNLILPLKVEARTLDVAAADPDDDLRDVLEEMTGLTPRFSISEPQSLARHIQRYYEALESPFEERIAAIVSGTPKKADIVGLSDLIIRHAITERASDIHITPETLSTHVFFRIDGVLHHYYALPPAFHYPLLTHMKVQGKLDVIENLKSQSGEFSVTFPEDRYAVRISTVPTIKGEKAALRLLSTSSAIYNLQELGFEEEMMERIERQLRKNSGLLLLVGPSGSGKTTTLYSLMRKVDILGQNVMSIEEPVEFKLPFISQLEVNRHTGLTFAAGLRHIARQDPDVIVIGEILDKETGQLAIQDALGGHLVLSTMFGSRFQSVITKLKNLPINSHVLADGLNAILSQRLIRRLCPHCKEAVEVDRETLQEHLPAAAALPGDATYRLYRHVGCDHCKQSGYLGRIALCELLEIDKEVRQMIRTDRESHELDAYLAAQQVKSLEEDALAKLLQGITDIAEITRLF